MNASPLVSIRKWELPSAIPPRGQLLKTGHLPDKLIYLSREV